MAKTLKTFNDPIYGFITIEDELIFKLLEHPYFQRLRRISQLGLTHLVFSGANHSRFQHALGAMHLMKSAINSLKLKGIGFTPEEEQGLKVAILLHDIGHGPFSHALENTIVKGINHEKISRVIMDELNKEFDGSLDLAIQIYLGTYEVKFLHQLVSSQLDMDRLDYLNRDSFFTGVAEGVIGYDRIIKMLNVIDDQLVVDIKGIYSLEKFLMARRLMYWQVYLHKTVLSAEFLLMNILLRAREVGLSDGMTTCSKGLDFFLLTKDTFSIENRTPWLNHFLRLDDFDIMSAVKQWAGSNYHVLSVMSEMLLHRKLLKTKLLEKPLKADKMEEIRKSYAKQIGWAETEVAYLVFERSMSNQAYNPENERINVQFRDGSVHDIAEAATIFQFSALNQQETKHYLYYPANLRLS